MLPSFLDLLKVKHDCDKRSRSSVEQNRDIARVMKAVKSALRRGRKKFTAYKRMPLWNKQTMLSKASKSNTKVGTWENYC